jgi:hypothetical protein
MGIILRFIEAGIIRNKGIIRTSIDIEETYLSQKEI